MNQEQRRLTLKDILSFLSLFLPDTFAKRLVAATMLVVEIPVKNVATLLDMGLSTVYDLRKALMNATSSKEIMALFQMKPGCGRKSKTGNVADAIKSEIDSGCYSCLRSIQEMIKDRFQIALSIASTAVLIGTLGIKRLKAASFPANANPSLQQEFYTDVLLPFMKKAKKGDINLLFMDGSHFVMGCDFLGYVYGSVRRFLRSHSGRKRYNVLGALDFVTKKVHTVTNDTYLTAKEVIEMMYKITSFYGEGKPIRVILDNARYQKCKAVEEVKLELQKSFDFDFVYLPSYSPNLNLVERIWRFVKTELRSRYTTNMSFNEFCTNIDEIIESTTGTAKTRINSLIGEKVQVYDSLIPVDAHTYVMPREEKKVA